MEIPKHRHWMYNRLDHQTRDLRKDFIWGVEKFLDAASELNEFKNRGEIRCPCSRCKCVRYKPRDEVRNHLYRKGFQPDYYVWYSHGETTTSFFSGYHYGADPPDSVNNYEQMVYDAGGASFHDVEPDEPNPTYANFYDLLRAAQSPLWDGCEDHSVLSMATRILSIKSDYNIAEGCIDEIIQLIREVLPTGNRMLANFYQTKRLLSQLGCGHKQFDVCESGCMLYRGADANERNCKFCGEARFKEIDTKTCQKKEVPRKQMWYLPIVPRLQRLYASTVTAKHMTWHSEKERENGALSHPCDGEAWKHFDLKHPMFASEPRNVRLGLCSDGFSPFNHGGSGKNYSCWPVILTPYNLPPNMCMNQEYMFLTIIIPGPNNPKSKIDVYLQPLIDDLRLLWDEGVQTWDVSREQNFCMRASLCWTINDFPAYGMLSGWSTAGKLGCPICMDDSKAFYLQNGRKVCYFDSHIGFKITNGDGRKVANDANVLALLEEHEYVENIDLYLELDDTAKPIPFKLPKDASVFAPMTNKKDTTQVGEKETTFVGNSSQLRSASGRGHARRGNHGSSTHSIQRGNSAPASGYAGIPHVVPHSTSLNSHQLESTQGSTVKPTKVVDDGEPTSKITIVPCGFEFKPSRVVHKISEIIKARYTKAWLNWKEIPEEHKAMWFGEFKKQCSWEKVHHEKIIEIWKQKSSQIIRQSLGDIRRGRASGSWMGKDILEALQDKWKTDPNFLELSKRNKVNSAANEGKVNRGGAISISERRRRCEHVYQREVHIPEIIVNLNFDEKTQKWLTPYAGTVIGKFNTMKEDAISRGEEVDDSTLFLKACGGKNKRGKAFGMGSELCKYTKSSEGEEVDNLNKRLKSLESEVNRVHELAEENKHLKSEMAELRSLVQKLAGNNSGDHSCGPSYVPNINDDRCDDNDVDNDDDGRDDSDGCDDSDGTRDDGAKDNSCVGPGFSYDGSV